jgi:starvation-inducible outer membrane lipoprotein
MRKCESYTVNLVERNLHESDIFEKHMLAVILAVLTGCASVPMAPKEQDAASKTFKAPSPNMAGVYIYRDSFGGKDLESES